MRRKYTWTNIEISVDGSIDCERASIMRRKGASIFVGGTSGIYRKGKDIHETIKQFRDCIK